VTLAIIVLYIFFAGLWWGAHAALAPSHCELMIFSGLLWPLALVGFGSYFTTRLVARHVRAFLSELEDKP
jgi:hypothetical protein